MCHLLIINYLLLLSYSFSAIYLSSLLLLLCHLSYILIFTALSQPDCCCSWQPSLLVYQQRLSRRLLASRVLVARRPPLLPFAPRRPHLSCLRPIECHRRPPTLDDLAICFSLPRPRLRRFAIKPRLLSAREPDAVWRQRRGRGRRRRATTPEALRKKSQRGAPPAAATAPRTLWRARAATAPAGWASSTTARATVAAEARDQRQGPFFFLLEVYTTLHPGGQEIIRISALTGAWQVHHCAGCCCCTSASTGTRRLLRIVRGTTPELTEQLACASGLATATPPVRHRVNF